MELFVDPAALCTAARELARTGTTLTAACGHTDATMAAGCASLDGAAADQVRIGWARLSRAAGDLAGHYARVGEVLDALAHTYAELDREAVAAGGGAR